VYTLARVHVERLILDAFVAAIERCEDEELRPVLERLCSVYVLEEVQRDRGWFQEHGRISSTRAKAVTKTLNTLVEELRPDAGALVDAFGIPDAVLAAPIGWREVSVGEQVSGSQ
jgi:acyl-CoA oxidase